MNIPQTHWDKLVWWPKMLRGFYPLKPKAEPIVELSPEGKQLLSNLTAENLEKIQEEMMKTEGPALNNKQLKAMAELNGFTNVTT